MSNLDEDMKTAIRERVKDTIQEAVEQVEEKKYKDKKKQEADHSDDEDSEEVDEDKKKKSESEDDSDEEDSEEDEEDDSQVDESLSVTAMRSGSRKKEQMNVTNIRELNRMASTGDYEYFTVTKPNGDEVEYHVDMNNKLVEM